MQTAINIYSLPQNIKPCISYLLGKPITAKENGGILGRQTAGLLIAIDLRKNGYTEEQIHKRLNIWNRNNLPPLKPSEIKGILTSCFKQKANGVYKYNPGCNGRYTELLQLEGACLGTETCIYYLTNYVKKGIKRKVNYMAIGWQYVLTPREQILLFYVIPELEKLKRVYTGHKLITNYRELHKYTGIDQKYFKDILGALKQYGLIEYTPGTQRLWEHKGTEIKRIIPPPKIPAEYINKPKEYKHKSKGKK
jgi:hypothetical protein